MSYDKEDVYDSQIAPLMTQIIAICKEHKIPAAMTFQYLNDDGGPAFCTTTLPVEGETSPKLERVIAMMKPERPICIAETHVTNPDGSKIITSRLVR